jgi:hypothetical protein
LISTLPGNPMTICFLPGGEGASVWKDKLMALSDAEFKQLLARAFDGAWDRYYSSGRATIDPEIARPKLANVLVKIAMEGERDEESLVAAGVSYLIFQNSLFLDSPNGPFPGLVSRE